MNRLEDANGKSVKWIDTQLIDLPSWDIRYTRDSKWEYYFTEEIKRHGIRDPLHVLKKNGRYLLLEGFTRFKAARFLGIKKIPCIIHEKLDVDPQLFAFRLNMWRRTLGVVSVARMAYIMRFEWNWTLPQIAEELGCTARHVYRLLELLNRDPKELEEIELGLRPAWQKKRKNPHHRHHVTHEGENASSGVRCPICGAFPKKGEGKWIYICSEHQQEYEAIITYIMREGWRTEKQKPKPIRTIKFIDKP